MSLKWFICPDGERIEVSQCLKEGGCRRGERCASRSYLHLVSRERKWTGTPSTTQLIAGTMYAFLKLTQDYAVSPDSRAFMINGIKGHKVLEDYSDEFSEVEQSFKDWSCLDCGQCNFDPNGEGVCPFCGSVDIVETEETGIADYLETENGVTILGDNKVSGSYKVAKALGFKIIEVPTDEVYTKNSRWHKKGDPIMRKILRKEASAADIFEWTMQLNKYRIEVERRKLRYLTSGKIDRLKIQALVRDGNTYIARSRGIIRNVYYFDIPILPDEEVIEYFRQKRNDLLWALRKGKWERPCSTREAWEGLKCERYCEVAEFCPIGKILKKEREKEVVDMPIKGVSEITRFPRAGKIRLGTKRETENGRSYPVEVDYFIPDPACANEEERKGLIDLFHQKYGDKPKRIPIMFPVGNMEMVFPQYYKRYGQSTLLKCKGDGETAVCTSPDFVENLEVIGKDERGLPIVKCLGDQCPLFQARQCSRVGTLQFLLPEMPGAGVWQLTTGSFNSIVNINSCMKYILAVATRFHMIPLYLERRAQVIQHEGKARQHYILHIDFTLPLTEYQKMALIPPERIMLELPAPEEDPADIAITSEETPVKPEKQGAPEKEETKKMITPSQLSAINNLVKQKEISESELYIYLASYDVEHPSKLTEEEAGKLIEYLNGLPAKEK